jgi:allantoate deiminase
MSESPGKRSQAMIDALAAISSEPGRITRLYLTPEHRRATELVSDWMAAAGMAVHIDSAGTVHGLLASEQGGPTGAKRLLIGSHIDSVVDAGRFDGPLGVVAGILAVEELRAQAVPLPFALEVLAFGDEEGVRFPKTLSSSSAIAGILEPGVLEVADAEGVTLKAALSAFGCDPAKLPTEAYDRGDVLGYLEVHIEQGPVLERAGEALGVVSAIASQGRYRLSVRGEAGHAGTVPMKLRHDALAGAADIVLGVEDVGRAGEAASLVATVGTIKALPGAGNVIPGAVEFSLDVRASDDRARVNAAGEIRKRAEASCAKRGLTFGMETVHEKPVAKTAPRLNNAIAAAIGRVTGKAARSLTSGAGHDGQAMVHLTDIGMIFVRCRGGISHNPAEFVSIADQALAVDALVQTIKELALESEA